MKHVVITGATSMIGLALIDACLDNNCEVIALVRPCSNKKSKIPNDKRISIVNYNLDELDKLDLTKFGMVDAFYHFAWSYTDKKGRLDSILQSKNIEYTLKAIELAHKFGCKKFIGAGSQAEYGIHIDKKTSPNSPINPQIAYGVAKYSAGRLGSISAKSYNMDFLWARIFSVYGKNDMLDTMISSTIKKLKNGEHCSFSPATHTWDYLYSEDAGKAFYLMGEKATGNKIYCLGSGEGRQLKDYIEDIRRIINPKAELGFGEIPYNSNIKLDMCADIADLQKDTGWEPKITFEEGIRSIVQGGIM